MRVGFTGTQKGMTDRQRETVKRLLSAASDINMFWKPDVFHHGDCIGADEQADEIARGYGYEIVVHPPLRNDKRAFVSSEGVTYREPKEYLTRNVDIVNETDLLIATPKGFVEEKAYSGTWATIRRAREKGMRLIIVWPDGTFTEEGLHGG